MFKKPVFLFLLLSLAIVGVMFRGGNLLGAGESGTAFYSLKRMLEISSSPLYDALLGVYIPSVVANIPLFTALNFFQLFGISGYLLQAGFFFSLIFLSLLSMYLLAREFFPQVNKLAWILSALFYLFNLYTMMNIWNRYLLNFMLFFSIIPLALFLLIRGLRLSQFIYCLWIALLTAVFSYGFSAPSQVATFWLVISLTSLFYFIHHKKKWFTVKFYFLTLFLWFCFNFWWISQQIYYYYSQAFQSISTSFFTAVGNQETFNILSNELGKISNLFLFKHGTFFTRSYDLPFAWPLFYNHPISLIIQWIFVLTTLYVIIINYRLKWIKFLLGLFILAIYLSKGNAAPLGEIFGFLFNHVSVLQFFRNPFEKLGVLLVLAFSPLFGFAGVKIADYMESKKQGFGGKVIGLYFVYVLVFLGFPFFTDLVFTNEHFPSNDPTINNQVKVPSYYKEADKWLSSQNDIFRFISLPLGGEGIFYKWPKGFVGVEQSTVLFSTPSISYQVGFPFYYQMAGDLERLFINYNDFYKVAAFLNAKYILFRPDIDNKHSNMRDPKIIENLLEIRSATSSAKLKLDASFGPLKFYKFSEELFLPKIYAAKDFIFTNKLANLEDVFIGNGKLGDVLLESKKSEEISRKTSIIHSQVRFSIKGPLEFEYTDEITIFPFVYRLPTSKLYKLALLRDQLENSFLMDQKAKTEHEMMLLGKRLAESKKAIEEKNDLAAMQALLLYQEQFPRVIKLISLLPFDPASGQNVWNLEFVKRVFSAHIAALEKLEEQLNSSALNLEIIKVKKLILDKTSSILIFPIYRPILKPDFQISNRQIYQFKFENKGEYELVFPETNWQEYFDIPKLIKVQIDNELFERLVEVTKEGYISFGKFNFQEGIHEIGFNLPKTKNLVEVPAEIRAETLHGRKEIRLPLKSFMPDSKYEVLLNYYLRSGEPPVIAFAQNIDPIVKQNKKSKTLTVFEDKLPQDDYWFDFREYKANFNSSKAADSGQIVFYIDPWNDCWKLLGNLPKKPGYLPIKPENLPKKCEDAKTKESFDRKTEVVLKDIKVTRSQTRAPVLRRIVQNSFQEVNLPSVSFTKANNKYSVSIKNATQPFLLIFSELYDSEWKAYYSEKESKNILSESDHLFVNGYANGWRIDRKGDFDLKLEFRPEGLLNFGKYISVFTIFLTLGLFTILKFKK